MKTGIEEIEQDFKELNVYLTDLYSNHLQKDGGNLWIAFTDKFNAFRSKVVALSSPPVTAIESKEEKTPIDKLIEWMDLNYGHVGHSEVQAMAIQLQEEQWIERDFKKAEDEIKPTKIDYPAAARVIHLWLKDFCDENLPFPEMIADAARKAAKEIELLKTAPSQDEMIDRLKIRINEKMDRNRKYIIASDAWDAAIKWATQGFTSNNPNKETYLQNLNKPL